LALGLAGNPVNFLYATQENAFRFTWIEPCTRAIAVKKKTLELLAPFGQLEK
jgi:hypothetical protein